MKWVINLFWESSSRQSSSVSIPETLRVKSSEKVRSERERKKDAEERQYEFSTYWQKENGFV